MYTDEMASEAPSVLRCALLIAQAEYPDLDMASCDADLDTLAELVEGELSPRGERYPLKVLRAISDVLYEQVGFCGNAGNYYEPDNSYINRVLERHTGIPISLALVYMEVAARVGLPMVAVNIPAHLMLRPQRADLHVLVDAFKGGELCYLEDAQEVLSDITGLDVRLDPVFVTSNEGMSASAFLLRMLSNLKQIYTAERDLERSLRIIRFMRATDPVSSDQVRDEGLCLYALGRLPESSALLGQYLGMAPKAEDAERVVALMARMAMMARPLPDES
ncbi:hypothetical protein FOA52_008967 [Chlamydomonas sp. UWO 241]|nr:hypothetical protein FOA52_008967 [Chlamydomonas sp. UWO 241]